MRSIFFLPPSLKANKTSRPMTAFPYRNTQLYSKQHTNIIQSSEFSRIGRFNSIDFFNSHNEFVSRLFTSTSFQPNHWVTVLLAGLIYSSTLGEEQVFAEETMSEADKTFNEKVLEAAKNGDLETLKKMVNHQNYHKIRNGQGETLLLEVANYGYLPIIQWLIESGIAKADEKDGHHDMTVFLRSAFHGHEQSVEWLLKSGYSAKDERNIYGSTALIIASGSGKSNIVKRLLNEGWANIAEKNDDDQTALLYAVQEGRKEVVEFLLDHGAVIYELSPRKIKTTALLYAAYGKNEKGQYPDIIKLLLKKGASVRDRDENGCTPLLHAAKCGRNDLVKVFVDYGADVNESDRNGTTALHFAILNNDPELAKFLLDNGANVDAEDGYGTPYDIIGEKLYIQYIKKTREGFNSAVDFEKIENRVKNKELLSEKDFKELQNQRDIQKLLHNKGRKDYQEVKDNLEKQSKKIQEEKVKDVRSVVETFRKNLSEKLNVALYTDKAIWEGTVKSQPGTYEKYLEAAQLVSAISGDVAIRIAANLVKIYTENKLDEYRVSKTAYVEIFDRKPISEVAREAAKMVGERYKEQLWELSAEGLDDFSQYFCDKLIQQLRAKYNKNSVRTSEKTIPIVRELFEIMIDPSHGRSVPLQRRGKDKKELNRDKVESWDTRELVKNVGIVVKRKYLEAPNIVVYLQADDELNEKIEDWKQSHTTGSILFALMPNNQWKGVLIKNKEKETEEKIIGSNSDLGAELGLIKRENVSLFDTNKIQNQLKKDSPFESDKPDKLYELKQKDEKYKVCYGDKYDVLNPKYSHCDLGMFWCRPPTKTSDLGEYENRVQISQRAEHTDPTEPKDGFFLN